MSIHAMTVTRGREDRLMVINAILIADDEMESAVIEAAGRVLEASGLALHRDLDLFARLKSRNTHPRIPSILGDPDAVSVSENRRRHG